MRGIREAGRYEGREQPDPALADDHAGFGKMERRLDTVTLGFSNMSQRTTPIPLPRPVAPGKAPHGAWNSERQPDQLLIAMMQRSSAIVSNSALIAIVPRYDVGAERAGQPSLA